MPKRRPTSIRPDPSLDKRSTARSVNKPQASRQPHTGVNRAKDVLKVDRSRGRGTGKRTGKSS